MPEFNGETGAYFRDSETPRAILQALRDRVLTRYGTRLMRPGYGSFLPDRIGQFLPDEEIADALSRAARAEYPRLILDSVSVDRTSPTAATAYIRGRWRSAGGRSPFAAGMEVGAGAGGAP